MANKKLWFGMLAMVLAFGLSVIGCDNGTTDKGGGGDDTWTTLKGTWLMGTRENGVEITFSDATDYAPGYGQLVANVDGDHRWTQRFEMAPDKQEGIVGNSLYSRWAGKSTREFDFSVNGNTLTISNGNTDEGHDFLNGEYTRQ